MHQPNNKYRCHIANKAYTANMLQGHGNPTFSHKYSTTQSTTTLTTKCVHQIGYIFQILDKYKWEMYVNVYATYKVTGISLKRRISVYMLYIHH